MRLRAHSSRSRCATGPRSTLSRNGRSAGAEVRAYNISNLDFRVDFNYAW